MKFSRTYVVFLIALFSILACTRTAEAVYPLGSEVVFYHFEDGATATSTNSGSSGVTNDGTPLGAASTTATRAKFGSRSLSAGETGDYMRTYYGSGINPTTQSISVSMWVYKGTNTCTADDDHVFGVSGSPTANRFYIRCKNSTTNKWGYRIQGNAEVFSTASVSTTTWDHIVLVANASTDQTSFYVNGVAIGSPVAFTSFTLPGNFYVGNYNDTVASDLTQGAGALIDEVAIYSTALTASDVNELYQAGQVGGAVSSLAATGYDQKAYLSWTAGAGTTTDFLVEYKLSSEPTTWTVFSHASSTTPNITVTGLTNGLSYDFRVTPRNNDIFGTVSSTVTATPVVRTVFVSPTPTQSSTITNSYFTASASTSLATASLASSTQVLRLETGGGSLVSQVSTTTRYGDYNVTHLVNTLSGSDLSLGNNSSGIAYVGTTDTLFIVHNNTTGLNSTIDEVDKNGTLLRQIVCTTCGDIEGIVLISSVASTTAPGTFDHTFMLSSENDQANAEIYRVVINSTGTTPVNKNDYFDTGITHGSNTGLEGIAYNPTSGVFYVAREHTSPALYEVTLGSGHSATSVQICSGLTLGTGVNDFTDLFYKDGILFVGSEDATSRIIPINITSTSSCAYVDSDGDSDVSATDTGNWLTVGTVVGITDQIEGLTWDDTGDTLYVLGEADFLGKYRSTVFTTQNTFSGLADGNYVLKASSLDTNGITSSSTDRAFTISTVVVSTSTVTSQAASNVATSTARFNATLTSDGNASSTNYGFEYGPTTSYGTILNTGGSLPLGAFYRDVTGLTPATTYHYRAFVTNSAGTASSTDQTFTTNSLGDTTAPNLSSVASTTTAYTATIQWNTNEPAVPQVNYGLTTGYGSATSSSVLGSTHSLTITNLTPSTTYHFQITAQDPSANSTSSVDYTFRTIADVIAPVVSNLVVTPNQSGATLTWTTDENATSSVSYGTSASYGSTSTSTGNTSHSATISGFDQGVVVHYNIYARDLYGNVTSTSDSTFTTLTAQVAAPTPAPVGPLGGSGGGSVGGPVGVNTPATPQQPQAQPQTPSPVAGGAIGSGLTIKSIASQGKKSSDIIVIQKLLNSDPATIIAKAGPGSPGKETNLYGIATKAAVIKFQLKYGIVKSPRDAGYGVVGPKTRAKMNELLAKKS